MLLAVKSEKYINANSTDEFLKQFKKCFCVSYFDSLTCLIRDGKYSYLTDRSMEIQGE